MIQAYETLQARDVILRHSMETETERGGARVKASQGGEGEEEGGG